MALTEASPTNRRLMSATGHCRIVLAANCLAGDALGYSSGWKPALATTGTAIKAELVALENGLDGETIEAAASAVLGGFSGGTPGGPLYQAEGSAYGEYTESAPNTGGDVNTIIGRILSASEILVSPSVRAGTTV